MNKLKKLVLGSMLALGLGFGMNSIAIAHPRKIEEIQKEQNAINHEMVNKKNPTQKELDKYHEDNLRISQEYQDRNLEDLKNKQARENELKSGYIPYSEGPSQKQLTDLQLANKCINEKDYQNAFYPLRKEIHRYLKEGGIEQRLVIVEIPFHGKLEQLKDFTVPGDKYGKKVPKELARMALKTYKIQAENSFKEERILDEVKIYLELYGLGIEDCDVDMKLVQRGFGGWLSSNNPNYKELIRDAMKKAIKRCPDKSRKYFSWLLNEQEKNEYADALR